MKPSLGYSTCRAMSGQYFEFRVEGVNYFVRRFDALNPKRFSIKKVDDKFVRYREDYTLETQLTKEKFLETYRIENENA
jgi:hypothetical protein